MHEKPALSTSPFAGSCVLPSDHVVNALHHQSQLSSIARRDDIGSYIDALLCAVSDDSDDVQEREAQSLNKMMRWHMDIAIEHGK